MAQLYIQTGEFAALCGVTKHTLFHYDEIGLLRPAKVDARGYRYYHIHQLSTFDVIRSLRGTGMTLEAIKAYVDKRDVHAFLTILRDMDRSIKHDIDRLQRLRQSLQQTLGVTEESFHVPIDTLQFLERPTTYFIVTPGPDRDNDDMKAMAKALSEHIAYCRERYGYHTFSGGDIIAYERVCDGTFRTTYYSTEIKKPVKGMSLHQKPAGLCAVQYIRCAYEDLPERYAAFIAAIRERGYVPAGALYQQDVRNYLVETDHTQYVMKIEIPIKITPATGQTERLSL